MADPDSEAWTDYDRRLYSDHIKKLNTPRPTQTSGYNAISLTQALREYRSLVRKLRNMTTSRGTLTIRGRHDLKNLLSSQLDSDSGLHHPRHLDTADMAHDGLVLAIKIKNLKRLRTRRDPPEREFVHRMLVDSVLAQTQHAFAGHYGRMYALVETTDEALMIVGLLDHDLDRLIEPLVLEDIPKDERPRIISGIGRTWQEAKLVTRGSLRQNQVPLDDHEPSSRSNS